MGQGETERGGDTIRLALLSLGAGSTDVMSFLLLGGLFTSAMTGNAALFAISLGKGEWLAASRSLTALIGFAAGVALASALRAAWKARLAPASLVRRLLLLELVIQVAAGVAWTLLSGRPLGTVHYLVIALSACSMGMQAICAQVIGASGINTIVFTSILIRIVTATTNRAIGAESGAMPAPGMRVHLGTFAAYGAGALAAALFAGGHPRAIIWLPVAAVAFALGLSGRPR